MMFFIQKGSRHHNSENQVKQFFKRYSDLFDTMKHDLSIPIKFKYGAAR